MHQERRPKDLSLTAERRAQEPSATTPPEKTLGRRPGTPPKQRPAALTRRERRIKAILLKELERMNGKQFGAGLTYAEKQHLEKTLSPAFIDQELDKMRRQLQWLPRVLGGGALVLVLINTVDLWLAYTGGTLVWTDVLLLLSTSLLLIMPFIQVRSLRRKIWIYEALRELSDAEEMDVTLGQVAAEADALIERIVDRELDLDARMPARPTTKRERGG